MLGIKPLGGAEDAGPPWQLRLVGGLVGESLEGLVWFPRGCISESLRLRARG